MKKLIALALLLLPVIASAQMITDGQLVNSFSGGDVLNVGPGTAGFSFTVGTSDLQVQALGVYDTSGSGLTASHNVGIWDTSVPTPNLVASAVVGPTGTDINNFWYTSITPLTLTSGKTYVVAAQYADVDFDQVIGNATGTSLTGATYGHAVLSSGVGFDYPDLTLSGADQGFFGPNMSFSAVPEPTATALVTAAGLAILAAIRRWKARQAAGAAAA